MKLLITGFDPFGGSNKNPAQLAVELLPDRIGDFELKKLIIPTVFGEASRLVLEAAETFAPDVILCIGVAEGRDAVTPERIAVNIRDARIPDNAGNRPAGEFVVPEGAAAYFSTVPIDRMVQAIGELGISARISNTAGTFVCNDTFYAVAHRYHGTKTRVGFIHVPALPGSEHPSLPLEKTVSALHAAILACEK